MTIFIFVLAEVQALNIPNIQKIIQISKDLQSLAMVSNGMHVWKISP